MKSEIREYKVKLFKECSQTKNTIRNRLWKDLDKSLFEEFGNDVYDWNEVTIIGKIKHYISPNFLGYILYVPLQITPIEELYYDLQKMKERINIGL